MNNSLPNPYRYEKISETEQPKGLIDDHQRRYEPYLPSDGLIEAVRLAIALQRPLLLEGKPGSGKTQSANSLVYQLTKNNLPGHIESAGKKPWWPFYIWNIKSYTQARDGFYTFDAVGRLRDAQIAGVTLSQTQSWRDAHEIQQAWQNPKKYRKFGALGQAIQEPDKRAVLLIDEVDKADSDFTNDLLLELDQYRFDVPETSEMEIVAKHKPIIILTSNQEKPLPDAFLRRCLYFNIEFPAPDELEAIARQRFDLADQDAQDILLRSIEEFTKVRSVINLEGNKAPGTSEFLDFLSALYFQLETKAERDEVLNELYKRPAFLGTLLKNNSDIELYTNGRRGS
jgi:MoxR-like ATPase